MRTEDAQPEEQPDTTQQTEGDDDRSEEKRAEPNEKRTTPGRAFLASIAIAVAVSAVSAGSIMFTVGSERANNACDTRLETVQRLATENVALALAVQQPVPAPQSGGQQVQAPPPQPTLPTGTEVPREAVADPGDLRITSRPGEATDSSGRFQAIGFTATTMEGTTFSMDETKGEPVLLAFWTHW